MCAEMEGAVKKQAQVPLRYHPKILVKRLKKPSNIIRIVSDVAGFTSRTSGCGTIDDSNSSQVKFITYYFVGKLTTPTQFYGLAMIEYRKAADRNYFVQMNNDAFRKANHYILILSPPFQSRNSAVDIATGYGLDDR
jgi:hypothetical protein